MTGPTKITSENHENIIPEKEISNDLPEEDELMDADSSMEHEPLVLEETRDG